MSEPDRKRLIVGCGTPVASARALTLMPLRLMAVRSVSARSLGMGKVYHTNLH